MSQPVEMKVTFRNEGGAVYLSPFFGSTRGIAWSVEEAGGRRQASLEPIPISPPEPPPPPWEPGQSLREMGGRMTLLAPNGTVTIPDSENPRWVFPGPGTWKLRAHIVLRNYHPAARAAGAPIEIRMVSKPVTAKVGR